MSALLNVLADATRRSILERIAAGSCAVKDIAKMLPVTLPAVSQHLKVLREAGLVAERRQGRQRIYSAKAEALAELGAYVTSLMGKRANAALAPGTETDDALDLQAGRLSLQDWPDMNPDIIRVSFRIRMLARLIEQSMGETAASVGLLSGELLLLDALRRQGPPFESTPTLLRNSTWITLAGLGKQLDRLAAAGHVVRRPDPRDGRGSVVRLTVKGRRVLEKAARMGRTSADFLALNGFPGDELSWLAFLLRRLQHRIEELRDRAGS